MIPSATPCHLHAAPGPVARVLIALIRVYQRTLSPLLGPVCRFEPSCSRYSAACLQSHGAWRGVLLSLVRLSKCQPFHPGGIDLPPLPRAPAPIPAKPAAPHQALAPIWPAPEANRENS